MTWARIRSLAQNFWDFSEFRNQSSRPSVYRLCEAPMNAINQEVSRLMIDTLAVADRAAWEREQACRLNRLVERTELALLSARRTREQDRREDPVGYYLSPAGRAERERADRWMFR